MLHRATVFPSSLELLKKLMAIPALLGFYLARVTSLALQIGHRISVDLDLFGDRPFGTQEILDELQDLAPISIITQSRNILILNINEVQVDFVNYRYPLVADPLLEDGLKLLTLPDIGAMKLNAIAGRGRKRDFYDLYFLLKNYSLRELIGFYLKKYNDGSEFMVVRSLSYFEDADEDEDIVQLGEKLRWNHIKQNILKEVKKHYK